MGIFPIMMNVIQFWLIDSIVKASTISSVALEEDSPGVYSNHDREPLFQTPSDDEDDNHHPDDIENARSNARSRSPTHHQVYDKPSTGRSTPEEHKTFSTRTSDETADYSYPPSLTGSTSSNRNGPPRQAKNLLKNAKRRQAPPPLSLYTHNPPAVNSPGILAAQESLPPTPLVPLVAPIPKAVAVGEPGEAWAETWDDPDDWANRVGEEEWTGRRVEHKKGALQNAWNSNSTVQVGS